MSGSLSFATSSDSLVVSFGGANVTAAFTVAVTCKVTNPSGKNMVTVQDNGGAFGQYLKDNSSDALAWWDGTVESFAASVTSTTATWQTLVMNKAAGSATPRFHQINLSSGTVTRANAGTGARADKTASTNWQIGGVSGQELVGQVACVGIAKSSLSDGTIDTLTSYAGYVAASFNEIWRLEGSSPFNGTGTSTQTTLSGTSHSSDEPPSFWSPPELIFPIFGA